jgi:hypothetical protein
MQHVARLTPSRENVFEMLASSARSLSFHELSVLAAASGAIALAAAASGVASWMLLAGCYVAWSFAGWGILFHADKPRSGAWRILHLLIVGSTTAVSIVLGIGLFFWALGPRWVL